MRVFIGVIVGIAIATALVVWGVDRAFAEDYGTPIGVGTVLLGHANVTLTGAATAVQICPQNTSHRIGVYVNNTGSNAIQIGDSGTGGATDYGTPIAAGQTIALPTTAAVYGYSASGSSASCLENLR